MTEERFVFVPPYEGYSMQTDDINKNLVRNTKPVMKEDTTWRPGEPVQERFTDEAALNLGLVEPGAVVQELRTQLRAASRFVDALVRELNVQRGINDAMAKRIGELCAENDKKGFVYSVGHFLHRVWLWFDECQTD